MPHGPLISGEVRALPGAPARVPSRQGAAREAPGASVRLEKLSWMRGFVRDEFILLETLDLDAAAFSRVTGPLKEEQRPGQPQ